MYADIYQSSKRDPTFGGLAVSRLAASSNHDLQGVIPMKQKGRERTPGYQSRKVTGGTLVPKKLGSKKTTSIKLDIRPNDSHKTPGSLNKLTTTNTAQGQTPISAAKYDGDSVDSRNASPQWQNLQSTIPRDGLPQLAHEISNGYSI